jgi:hypothetical protein
MIAWQRAIAIFLSIMSRYVFSCILGEFYLNPGYSIGMAAFSTLLLFKALDFAFNLVMAVLRALIHLLAHLTFAFLTAQASTMYRLISVIVGQMAPFTITFNSCVLAGSLPRSIG